MFKILTWIFTTGGSAGNQSGARETEQVPTCLAIRGTHAASKPVSDSMVLASPSPASPFLLPPPPLFPVNTKYPEIPIQSSGEPIEISCLSIIRAYDGHPQPSPLPQAVHRARAHQQVRRQAGKNRSHLSFQSAVFFSHFPFLLISCHFAAASAGRHRCLLLAPQRRFDLIVSLQCID